MTFRKFKANTKYNKFIIDEDLPEIGWNIYIYDLNDKCIADYCQDTLEIAKDFVKERYNVSADAWTPTE